MVMILLVEHLHLVMMDLNYMLDVLEEKIMLMEMLRAQYLFMISQDQLTIMLEL